MTRRECRNRLNSLLKVRDPLALDDFLNMATDEVATDTSCFFTAETIALEGTTEVPFFSFCAPSLIKIKSWSYIDSVGVAQIGNEMCNVTEFENYASCWRTDNVTGSPLFLIIERPDLYLYPRPTWSVTQETETVDEVEVEIPTGLTLYGFGVPGLRWETETSDYPLPDFTWNAVLYKACLLWDTFNPTKEGAARMVGIQTLYNRATGVIEARMAEEWGNSR